MVCVPEIHTGAALKLLVDDSQLLAPDIDRSTGTEILQKFGSAPIAVGTGRTFYDSIYLAGAIQHDCSLVTADEKLVNGLVGTPHQPCKLKA